MNQSKIKSVESTSSLKAEFLEKMKDLKTWVQVKSPKTFQPALSYALDWLSPELLGTGFRLFEISDFEIKALIPYEKTNLNTQHEIHQGLVTNAVLEQARVFLQRQMPKQFFQITETDIQLSKKIKWNDELNLFLKSSEKDMDDFFVQLQKFKKATCEFEIQISIKQNEKLKHVPAIMLTNLAGQADAENAMALGAILYLVKSEHDPREILEKVKEILAASDRGGNVPKVAV